MTKGFTLIELLIVVAIIAILAAIAVPNFLEAQTRAKVSRSKADIRTVVTALETYRLDTNAYPSDAGNITMGTGVMKRAYSSHGHTDPPANYTLGYELTTPVSYLNSVEAIVDPFRAHLRQAYAAQAAYKGREMLAFTNTEMRGKVGGGALATALAPKLNRDGPYCLLAAGPDGWVNNNYNAVAVNGFKDHRAGGASAAFPLGRNYDPTNGTISIGDIGRSPKFNEGTYEAAAPGT